MDSIEVLNKTLEQLDDMKQNIPEGVYLERMNQLKKRYDQLKNDDSWHTIAFKDVIKKLIETSVWFLKRPLELKEAWNKDGEDFGYELSYYRRYINYKYTALLCDRDPAAYCILANYEEHKQFLDDDLIDLMEIVSFLIQISRMKDIAEDIPELKKHNFRKINTKFYNKLFNIKYDITALTEAGYNLGHMNAKKHNKMMNFKKNH